MNTQMTVAQLMRPPTTTVEPDAHLAAAAYLIKHADDSAIVVTTDDTHEPLAMITDAEVTRAVANGLDMASTRIRDVACKKPLTINTDASASDAASLMLSSGVKHLPVVESGRLVGMVELADLYRAGLGAGVGARVGASRSST
jgi:CBS domain-containing protein